MEKNDDKNELQEILDNVQAEKEALMSKLELLQVEHDKIEFETENVEAANSNLKRELEEKNRESVHMKTENVRLMQSIADYRSKGDMVKKTVDNLSSVIREKDLEINGLNESLVSLVHESSKQQTTSQTLLEGKNVEL